ncbi:unnamed protein product, partial [Ectocarpus sp. 13 AM-2016]
MKHPPCSRLWAAVSTDVGDRTADSASRPLAARARLVNATNVPVPPLLPPASSCAAAPVARRRECCQSTAKRNACSSVPGVRLEHVVEPLEARARR